MFAKYLAQGFAETFRLKARLSREAFWPYLGALVGLFITTGLLLERAGSETTLCCVLCNTCPCFTAL
jgi:uncharacterized membrane protein YhaH (DUF805 family)